MDIESARVTNGNAVIIFIYHICCYLHAPVLFIMYLCYLHVSVLFTCICAIYMYLCYLHVSVLFTGTSAIYMYPCYL